ncbi:MAG TPA: hypothetical protein VF490_03900 [Chryseosolibacter sp.]
MRCAIFIIVILSSGHMASGQPKVDPRDSVDVKNKIEGFYSWYISLIKEGKLNRRFNPGFLELENGMTTLDFRRYKDALRKFKFSEDFIRRKINSYRECVDNLSEIRFDRFTQLPDVDDLGRIHCDFQNRYEWTGGMEPKDKAELTHLKFVDGDTILGTVSFTSHSSPDGHATVIFRRSEKGWTINDLMPGL